MFFLERRLILFRLTIISIYISPAYTMQKIKVICFLIKFFIPRQLHTDCKMDQKHFGSISERPEVCMTLPFEFTPA